MKFTTIWDAILRFFLTRAEYKRLDIEGLSDTEAMKIINSWVEDNNGEVMLVTNTTAFVRRWVYGTNQ